MAFAEREEILFTPQQAHWQQTGLWECFHFTIMAKRNGAIAETETFHLILQRSAR